MCVGDCARIGLCGVLLISDLRAADVDTKAPRLDVMEPGKEFAPEAGCPRRFGACEVYVIRSR